MELHKVEIKNYKSIKEIQINDPRKFLVFVGANAAGKSNIFEALEFSNRLYKSRTEAVSLYGGEKEILNFNLPNDDFELNLSSSLLSGNIRYNSSDSKVITTIKKGNYNDEDSFDQYLDNFSRIFVGQEKYVKIKFNDNNRLRLDCGNLELVLARTLKDHDLKEVLLDWLYLFIPGFKNIEITFDELKGEPQLNFYEESYRTPFPKTLISDGTYNIIALLTAVLQSKEPQFLCIEEPENGLNPKVIRELVKVFRSATQKYGHYIWINTHSPTFVSELEFEELIVVDKKDGFTLIKQFKNQDFKGLKIDDAWLSNSLGGGIPW
ncbi:MAG: AAA family ATPase [Ignavibacteriaceae bacterium]|nr:AAA family ATPase [Ignavibacteriaceae bacterium]